jgi:hypothetical protein
MSVFQGGFRLDSKDPVPVPQPVVKSRGKTAAYTKGSKRKTYANNPLLTTHDEKLAALVGQAWELRETPWFLDAISAVLNEHDRRQLSRYESRSQRTARLVRLVRGG